MRSDQITNGIKLLVALGGLIAKPSLLGAVSTGLSMRELLQKIFATLDPDVKSLANSLTAEAEVLFADFARDLPDEADILYSQMVEFSLPTPAQLMLAELRPETITETMLARLDLDEHRRAPMPDLFRALTVPTLRKLLENKHFTDSLTPAFMTGVIQALADQHRLLEELSRSHGSLSRALDALADAKRDQLEALAGRFEIVGAYDLSDADLLEQLSRKAAEYRDLRAQIDLLNDHVPALAALKSDAAEAAERLDFFAVEQALSRVDEVETEAAATTKIARARNALMREDTALAARLLAAAADSFGGTDPLAPARKRLEYIRILLEHGFAFGLPALKQALLMGEEAARAFSDQAKASETRKNRADFADAISILGIAFFGVGQSAGGEEGKDFLRTAAQYHRRAARIYRDDGHAQSGAMALNNLGNSLRTLGTRTEGQDGEDDLRKAIEHYEAALKVASTPEETATRRNNLAVTQQDLAVRLPDADALALLHDASASHLAALAIRTREAAPRDWATSRSNLGGVRIEQGRRTEGPEGQRYLQDAIADYEAAGEIHGQETLPQLWATNEFNLATAKLALAQHDATVDKAAHLVAALAHCDAALDRFTQSQAPQMWARTLERRAEIEAALKGT